MPLTVVFVSAFGKGISAYFASFRDPDAIAAIRLTLIAAGIAVPFVDSLDVLAQAVVSFADRDRYTV